mgnify:CR=1 FL=1
MWPHLLRHSFSQHLRDKQWDKAMVAIDRLDKKIPNNPLTNNLRGTVSMGKGDVAGARKFLEARGIDVTAIAMGD